MKILLLTHGAIDFPVASGEVMRKIVGAMPPNSICWASLNDSKLAVVRNVVATKAFPLSKKLSWRIRMSVLGSIVWKEVHAIKRARAIACWAQEFKPDLIWILAEEDAVNVGYRLSRLMGVPVHLTFHDAPEIITNIFGEAHSLVAQLYKRRLRQLIERANSMDAVCRELIEHVLHSTGTKRPEYEMVFPPSLPVNVLDRSVRDARSKEIKKIGFCGSLRTSETQWINFLKTLSVLPFTFEIVAFMDKNYFPDVEMPKNVVFKHFDFVATDDFLQRFTEEGVDACYLGLYKDEEWSLFCRTSLSSKLATYAAAGLPMIVDAPSGSVVWRYVKKYGAGILCDNEKNAIERLNVLFADNAAWNNMADGSRKMFECEFDLNENVRKFCEILMMDREKKEKGMFAHECTLMGRILLRRTSGNGEAERVLR